MQIAYSYIGKIGDESFESEVVAANYEEADELIRSKGIKPILIEINWNDTVALISSKSVNSQSLSVFYRSFGARILANTDPALAVRMLIKNQANVRLKLMMVELDSHLSSGKSIGESMRLAKFPKRDYAVISAMSDSTRMAKTLQTIADDYDRISEIRRKIKGMMFEPLLIYFLAVGLIWADFAFLMPKMHHFFAQLNDSNGMPTIVKVVLEFGVFFAKHQPISTIIYFAAAGGLTILLFSKVFRKTLMILKPFRLLSIYSDNAMIWSSLRLLQDTNNEPYESALLVSEAAVREDSRRALIIFAEKTKASSSQSEAVEEAGFPETIAMLASTAFAAPGRQAVLEGLDQLIKILILDVNELSDKVSNISHVITLLAGALIVLFLAFTSLIPMLLAVISQA